MSSNVQAALNVAAGGNGSAFLGLGVTVTVLRLRNGRVMECGASPRAGQGLGLVSLREKKGNSKQFSRLRCCVYIIDIFLPWSSRMYIYIFALVLTSDMSQFTVLSPLDQTSQFNTIVTRKRHCDHTCVSLAGRVLCRRAAHRPSPNQLVFSGRTALNLPPVFYQGELLTETPWRLTLLLLGG